MTALLHERDERVYYDATDAMGVVYHARYFEFMERARSDWLRLFGERVVEGGMTNRRFSEELSMMFVVTRISSRFRKPARLDDALTITVELAACRGASMDFVQRVLSDTGELLCSAELRLGCVNSASMEPMALPTEMKMELQQLLLDE